MTAVMILNENVYFEIENITTVIVFVLSFCLLCWGVLLDIHCGLTSPAVKHVLRNNY